jgi:hypothetical protein
MFSVPLHLRNQIPLDKNSEMNMAIVQRLHEVHQAEKGLLLGYPGI